MRPFNIPQKPEELEHEGRSTLHVSNTLDASSLTSEDEVATRAQDLLFQLDGNDPLHATADQECFDNLYYTVKAFAMVGPQDKVKLFEILGTNLSELAISVQNLRQDHFSSSDPVVTQHRSAVQLHAFFLNWVLLQAEAVGARDEQEQRQADAGKKGSRGRKAGAAASKKGDGAGAWDLARCRERAIRAASKLLAVDMSLLYPAKHEKNRLVDTCVQMAARAVESQEAMKRSETKSSAVDVLILAAKHHDKLAHVAETLVAACRRMEHVPEVAAHVAILAQEAHGFPCLAEQMITEFTLTSPELYDKEPEKHPGVKHLGDMLVCMAESRGLAKVRTKALKAWTMLVVEDKLPLPFWPELLKAVQQRLLDGKTTVVKAALQLFQVMVEHSPFGADLDADKLQATLKALEENLQALGPQPDGDANEDVQAQNNEQGAAWGEGGAVQVGAEHARRERAQEAAECAGTGDECCEGEMEARDEEPTGAAPGSGNADGDQEMEDLMQLTQTQSQGPLMFSNPMVLRTMIANMKSGIEFVRVIESSEVEIRKLLTMHDAGNIKEAINLVTLWKQGETAALEEILRRLCVPEAAGMDARLSPHVVGHIIRYMSDSYNDLVGLKRQLGALVRQQQGGNNGAPAAGSAGFDQGSAVPASQDNPAATDSALTNERFAAAYASSLPEVRDVDSDTRTQLEEQYTQHLSVLHSAVGLVAMVAAHNPGLVMASGLRIVPLLEMLQGAISTLKDAWVVRHCCLAVKALSPQIRAASAAGEAAPPSLKINSSSSVNGPGAPMHHQQQQLPKQLPTLLQGACHLLVQVLVTPHLGLQNWQSAAGAALGALYTLHPTPSTLTTPLLKGLLVKTLSGLQSCSTTSSGAGMGGAAATGGRAGQSLLPESDVVRLLFLTGHVAMHQLVLIERLAKEIRRKRMEHERAASHHQQEQEGQQPAGSEASSYTADGAQRQAEGGSKADKEAAAAAAAKEDEDIAQQLGCGSVAADAALDALHEQIDAEILGRGSLLCAHPVICESALLALSKLMAVDGKFCEDHMRLLFTHLSNKALGAAARSNLVIALGDLAVRFPNITEPWTPYMYAPLGDGDLGVRRTSLTVLGHLILNDMMKVKGNIARIALRLVDDEEELRIWARRFFATLAQRSSGARGGSNPIYNLLPDIMSALVREPTLDAAGFTAIMEVLLPYVKDSKQADAFKEKLCQRFEALQEVNVASAADFAAAHREPAAAAAAAVAAGDGAGAGGAAAPAGDGSGATAAQHAPALGPLPAADAADVDMEGQVHSDEVRQARDGVVGGESLVVTSGIHGDKGGSSAGGVNEGGGDAHKGDVDGGGGGDGSAMHSPSPSNGPAASGKVINGNSGGAHKAVGNGGSGGGGGGGSAMHSPSLSSGPAASGDSFFSACSAGGAEASSFRSASASLGNAKGGTEAASSDRAAAPPPPAAAADGGRPAGPPNSSMIGSWGDSMGITGAAPGAEQGAGGSCAHEGAEGPFGMQGQGHGHKVSVVEEWRALATVLKGMGHSEKGLRAIMERRRCYKHALGDEQVFKVFWAIAEEGRKKASKDSTLREDATHFRDELEEIHKALRVGNADDGDGNGGGNEDEGDQREGGPTGPEEVDGGAGAGQGDVNGGEDVEMEDQHPEPAATAVAAPSQAPSVATTNRRRGRAQREEEQLEDLHNQGAELAEDGSEMCTAETPSGKPPKAKRRARNGRTPAAMKLKPGELLAAAQKGGAAGGPAKRGGRDAAKKSKKQQAAASSSEDEEEGEGEESDSGEDCEGRRDDDAGHRDQSSSRLDAQTTRLSKVHLGGGAQRVAVKQEPN
ncbi:hypothetical protein DUNSADRAFT_12866 [Dunaliella salina]|uniref:Condensin complex subunit 1 n=1 Tax=Dunaliella salina TaxID=3046 RepID=A0ABQ7H9S1_DUNSA|nr:hypothetical protein DUNSADRAFT_12866 [Dunaliella salina]|eukprot:KAF5843603.1 hypothetical protein DUNSADRAFT_12866 [Dunaliella salina]